MQFHRKTSNSLSSGLIRLLIKAIIILAVISIIILILDNIDLPEPNKILLKIIPKNEYGNTLESLIGAIYIDNGIRQAQKFIIKHIYNSGTSGYSVIVSGRICSYKSLSPARQVCFTRVE